MNYSLIYRPLEAFEGLDANTKNKSIRRKYTRRVNNFLKEHPVKISDIQELFDNRKYQTLFSDIIKSKAGGLFDITISQSSINGRTITCTPEKSGYRIECENNTILMKTVLSVIFPSARIERVAVKSVPGYHVFIYDSEIVDRNYDNDSLDKLREENAELKRIIDSIRNLVDTNTLY